MHRHFAIAIVALLAPTILTAAPRLRTPDPNLPVGTWRIIFQNGVVQTCQIGNDGTASAAEPLRSSPGKWKFVDGVIVITFNDDRLERWSPVDGKWVVEHWCPALAYPCGSPVVGAAKRE